MGVAQGHWTNLVEANHQETEKQKRTKTLKIKTHKAKQLKGLFNERKQTVNTNNLTLTTNDTIRFASVSKPENKFR